MEVKVSDAGGTVDVSATTAEGDAVGLLLLKLHARFAAIKRMRK